MVLPLLSPSIAVFCHLLVCKCGVRMKTIFSTRETHVNVPLKLGLKNHLNKNIGCC